MKLQMSHNENSISPMIIRNPTSFVPFEYGTSDLTAEPEK
jgi:hypothetical protein